MPPNPAHSPLRSLSPNPPHPMNPTPETLSDALGLAHGFAADHDPSEIPGNPRDKLAMILDLPALQIPPTCVLAYFDGLQDGRDYRRELDSLGAL